MIHIYGAFHEAALERAIEILFQALDKPSLEKLFKKLASKEGIKIPNISAQIITLHISLPSTGSFGISLALKSTDSIVSCGSR